MDRNLSSHLEFEKVAGKSGLLMTIFGLHWRLGWCCVELHFGTVLGDEFGLSSLNNSIPKTNPSCNSIQHKIDNFQKSNEYAISINYFGFHKIACVSVTFFAPKGHFVSAIKQMRFFFSACTSEYESSFRSFPIGITKNSRLLMFAAAILRSCDDRSADRNYFSGVCNERKIIEKFSEEPTIRREKSEATRISDLAVANPVFTVQSG